MDQHANAGATIHHFVFQGWEGDPSLLPMRGRTSCGVNEGRPRSGDANCRFQHLMASEGPDALSRHRKRPSGSDTR